MSIATRKGDQGETDLLFGCRLAKSHPRVHALGAVDELNAALGPLRIAALREETQTIVPQVQRWLITLMGELATPPGEETRYAETHSDRILADKDARARLSDAGLDIAGGTAAQMAAMMKDQAVRMVRLAKEAGIRPVD